MASNGPLRSPLKSIWINLVLLSFISTINALNKPPALIRSIDLSTINENAPVNSHVFQLVAHDPEGTPVSFELHGTDLLRVDRRTGIVSVAKSIDREKTGESINFSVIISDQVPANNPINLNGQTDEPNIVNIPVKLLVVDENDNSPTWQYIDPNITIPEDMTPGTAIIKELIVNDADTVGSILRATCDGCNSNFHLQNLDTPSNSLIRLSLILTQHIEFRMRQNQFNITLYVSDGIHNSSQRLFITVKDVQNRPPVFIGSKEIALLENTPVGMMVYHVRAIDGDALNDEQMISLNEKSVNLQFYNFGRKLAYFLEENPGNFFSLNQHNGELKIATQLDREAAFLNHENNQTVLVVKFKAVEISDDNGQLDDQEVSTARSELVIRVVDVNDEKPTFDKEQYAVTIKENHQPGQLLSPNLVINVKDRDIGINSLFRVRLVEKKGSDYFQLNPTVIDGSGQITVWLKENVTLDYENIGHHKFNLLLEAKELKTKEKYSTTSHLLIVVVDTNDNAPMFLGHSYLANLIETAQPGTIIKSIQATDRDSPALTKLSYELRGDHANLFDLNPKTGMLVVGNCLATPGVAPCLDFERRAHYNLTVTVYDGFGLNSTVPLRVQLIDSDDNPPKFTRSVYEAEIEENADHFDTPVSVHATDADISSVLTYSLVSETLELLTPDHLILSSLNNMESIDDTIEPIAEDRMGSGDDLKTSGSSDELLSSSGSGVNYDFQESPITDSPIMEDKRGYHKLTASGRLHPGFESKQFAVDSKTGEIKVLRPVVYNEKPVVLTVKVSDGIHSARCKVKITVRDTNNNDPIFDYPVYHTNVSETAEQGQFVAEILAHDADVGVNALIFYTLLPNLDDDVDSHLTNDFVINNRTGIITVNGPLDYDRKNIYAFKLRAEDCGEPRRSSVTRVIIHVLNENNKKPYFKPSTQLAEVNEHTPVNTRVYKLIAEDPDHLVQQQQSKHLHGYRSSAHNAGGYYLNRHLNDNSLKGNLNEDEMLVIRIENMVALNKDGHQVETGSHAWHEINKFFAIDSSGYLVVMNQLRYELASLVTLNVSVSDTLATTAPQVGYGILAIKIIDYNDHPPAFNYPWTVLNPRVEFALNEEQPIGTIVGKLTATDVDTEIDYYKIDPPSRFFSIDNQTGVIRTEKVLDYETIREDDLKFTVRVYDTGVPQLNCDAHVYVNLINLNDNMPVFNQTDYYADIPENSEWDSFVIKLHATDRDKGKYGKITYSIVSPQMDDNAEKINASPDVMQYFYINQDTGIIRVQQGANLDREAGLTEFHFQVSAADNPSNPNAGQPTSDDLTLVTNNPVPTNNRFTLKNQLNSPAFADDLYGEESAITSELQQPKSFAFANVHIKITGNYINDNRPIIRAQTHTFKIYDYSDINKEYNFYVNYFADRKDELRNFVTQIQADDADSGLNGLIKYRILSGNVNNVFELDEITGKLYASKTPLKINREIYSYKLEIEARDQNGKGQLFDKTQLSISIHRVNKYKPQFLFPLGSNTGNSNGLTSHNTLGSLNDNVITVLENQPVGSRVDTIRAEDFDPGNNGIIKYGFKINSTHTDQETELFRIDPKTGLITTKVVFDREEKSQYSVVLSAADYLAEPNQFETLQDLIIKIGDLDDNLPEFSPLQSLASLQSTKPTNLYSKDSESGDHNGLGIGYHEESSGTQPALDYTYLFQITENLPKATVVGRVQAIDKDEKPENRKIFYFIVDGNEQGLFSLNSKTGVIQSTQPLDRESQAFYQLIIKATPNENYSVIQQTALIGNQRNLTQKFRVERERSYSPEDRSLAIVGIEVFDLNDNEPIFEKELYRVGVSHQAKLNETLVTVKANDPDSEVNATLVYSVVSIEMVRKYMDDPENPASPIPSPFTIDPNAGRLSVVQSMTHYPIQTRFVVHVEARERSSPFRIVRSAVHVYVYDPSKLIKITIKLRPVVVEQQRDNIEQLLSENLENANLKAVITSIKFHLDVRRGRVVHEYTDCFVLVVDERNLSDISPEKMISKLDSNAGKLIFANDITNYLDDGTISQQQHYSIEQITLASTMNSGSLQPLLYNFTSQLSSDTQTMVFFILIILIIIGFVSMAVSCCCLKSWYYQKLVERAQLAQQKNLFNVGATLTGANGIPIANGKYAPSFLADPNELYTQSVHSVHSYPAYGVLNGSLNGINQEGSLRRPRSKNSTLRQQVPNENNRTMVKENAVWLDGANKYFEEQELSVQVATMDLTDDSVNCNYSVKQNKNRQRLPTNTNSVQEIARKVNDYHELKNASSDTQSSDN